MASTRNNIGKSIYFSASLPATNDAAGFEALTWLELETPQTLPQFGVTHSNIDVPDLKSGFTKGNKGAASGVDSQGSCRIVDSALATNQATFKGICDSAGGDIALKIGAGSGTANALAEGDVVEYAQGYVHSYQENQATDSTHEGFTYNFKQNELTVKDTEPAA
jgi:hypothetical protein